MPFDSLNVLVVEDDPVQVNAAALFLEEFFARNSPPCPLAVRFAATLEQATALLPAMDGVICDATLPATEADEVSWQNAFELTKAAMRLGKPAILIAGMADQQHIEEVITVSVRLNALRYSVETFGAEIDDSSGIWRVQLVERKPWKLAFYGLLYLMLAAHLQAISITDEGGMNSWSMPPELEGSRSGFPDGLLLDHLSKWAEGYTQEGEGTPHFHRDYLLKHDPLTRKLDEFLQGTNCQAFVPSKLWAGQ